MSNDIISLIVWVAIGAAVFAFLWWKGYLLQLRNYVLETREELKKCTWPSWGELKGSTVVVMISVVILGVFTVGVDFLLTLMVQWVTKI